MQKINIHVPDADTFPQYLLELDNVYFGKYGAILDSELKLIDDAALELLFWTNLFKQRPAELVHEARVQPVMDLPDDAIYIHAQSYFNTYVYGHLWDTIQALKKIEYQHSTAFPLPQFKLVISKPSASVKNVKEHFKYFGFPEDRLVIHNGDHLLRAKRALYSTPHCMLSRYTKSTRDWMLQNYMTTNAAYQGIKDLPGQMHLYLSRGKPDIKASSRGVINEDEVWNFLKTQGFVKVTGEEPLLEHIRLFKDALVIIGPHGSLFKNTLFCQKQPMCYEFCAANRRCRAFEDNAMVNGHRYAWIPVLTDGSHHIKIPMEVLRGIPYQ